MTPSITPPPVPPPLPGMGLLFLACLFPALTMLVAWLSDFRGINTRTNWALFSLAFIVPAWSAWNLHRRRRAVGSNVLPNGWLAAGAGVLAGVVLCVAATVLAVVIALLVLFSVCALNGGKFGG